MHSQNNRKTVAIIGAGPGGLVSAKECLENNLHPTVFEKNSNIGGIWNMEAGFAWDSMTTNLSYLSCMFSDFPWPENTPDFPNHKLVYQYLQDYKTHFGLENHFKFCAEVVNVKRTEGKKDKYVVSYKEKNSEKVENLTFDFVIVASGNFSYPFVPTYPGQDKFAGKILHSCEYKNPEDFKGKKVIVVGGALSGSEIACDLWGQAEKITVITGSQYWFLTKYVKNKGENRKNKEVPLNLLLFNKSTKKPTVSLTEYNIARNKALQSITESNCNVPELQISSEDFTLPGKVAISNRFPHYVAEGKVNFSRARISSFKTDSIILSDQNSTELEADIIIYCTGYRLSLDYLSDDIKQELAYDFNDAVLPILLHRCTFNPGLPNMAFIGLYKGINIGHLEVQARWVTMVFGGNLKYPGLDEMRESLKEEKEIRERKPRPQDPRDDLEYVMYLIASEMGIFPDSEDEELKNLIEKCPSIPCLYRLCGYGSKPDIARKGMEQACKYLE